MGRKKTEVINRVKTQMWATYIKNETGLERSTDLNNYFEIDVEWRRWHRGEHVPTEMYRKLINEKLPGSKEYFDSGPNNFFKIYEVLDIRTAELVIRETLEKALLDSGIKLEETVFCFEGAAYSKWLSGLGQDIYVQKDGFGLDENVIMIAFAIGIIENRLIGDDSSLQFLMMNFIDYCLEEHGVSKEFWDVIPEVGPTKDRLFVHERARQIVANGGEPVTDTIEPDYDIEAGFLAFTEYLNSLGK